MFDQTAQTFVAAEFAFEILILFEMLPKHMMYIRQHNKAILKLP